MRPIQISFLLVTTFLVVAMNPASKSWKWGWLTHADMGNLKGYVKSIQLKRILEGEEERHQYFFNVHRNLDSVEIVSKDEIRCYAFLYGKDQYSHKEYMNGVLKNTVLNRFVPDSGQLLIMYKGNDSNVLTWETDKDSRLLSTTSTRYKYVKNSYRVKSVSSTLAWGDGGPFLRYKYQGRHVKKIKSYFEGGGLMSLTKFTRDQYGNAIKVETRNLAKDFESTEYINYEYDSLGNWTSRTIKDQNDSIIWQDSRNIVYYDSLEINTDSSVYPMYSLPWDGYPAGDFTEYFY